MKPRFFLVTVLLILGVSGQIFGGIYIEGTDTFADGSGTEKSLVYINSDRMRVENRISGKMNEQVPDAIIFRKDKMVMWVIDSEENNYSEISQQDLETMKSKIDEGMKMMQEQMKNMPPEQRKMMEEMMAKEMPGGMMQQEKKTYKLVASGVKFKSWTCKKYAAYLGGVQTAEILTIDPDQAGLDHDDFEVLHGFADFFSPLGIDANEFLMIGDEDAAGDSGFSGIPVKYVNMENGKATDTFEMEKIEKRNNPPALFELPENLTKKELW